jgi:hypothetical protein
VTPEKEQQYRDWVSKIGWPLSTDDLRAMSADLLSALDYERMYRQGAEYDAGCLKADVTGLEAQLQDATALCSVYHLDLGAEREKVAVLRAAAHTAHEWLEWIQAGNDVAEAFTGLKTTLDLAMEATK